MKKTCRNCSEWKTMGKRNAFCRLCYEYYVETGIKFFSWVGYK
jgi:hypothetical protein